MGISGATFQAARKSNNNGSWIALDGNKAPARLVLREFSPAMKNLPPPLQCSLSSKFFDHLLLNGIRLIGHCSCNVV